jgi:hypothetical protein
MAPYHEAVKVTQLSTSSLRPIVEGGVVVYQGQMDPAWNIGAFVHKQVDALTPGLTAAVAFLVGVRDLPTGFGEVRPF